MNESRTTPLAPFPAHVGIRYGSGSEDAVAEIELAPHHLNRSGGAHGGLIATLLDTAMSRAAFNACDGAQRVATIEMKASFTDVGKGRLVGRGWLLHRTASLVFCEAEVRDAADRLVAKASGTFKIGRVAQSPP